MKTTLLCASPASTAICVGNNNMDESSSVGHGGGGGRAIDRHNPHVRDGRRRSRINTTTVTSNPLIAPSYSSSPSKPHDRHNKSSTTRTSSANNKQKQKQNLIFNPSSSSRYLLSDTTFLDVLTEFEPLFSSSSSVPIQQSASSSSIKSDEYPTFPPTSSSSSSSSSSSTSSSSSSAAVSTTTTTAATACNDHQVVVLRVSLHCKGCEGKVRKHISKMKGVTSFCIDFGMKKVTVVGDVTPLGVLASISRVKNAHFWPSMSSSSSLK